MSARDYKIRKSRSKGKYVLNNRNGFTRYESGYIQPTGKWEKRQASKIARRISDMPNGNWFKKTTSVFEWS